MLLCGQKLLTSVKGKPIGASFYSALQVLPTPAPESFTARSGSRLCSDEMAEDAQQLSLGILH